MKLEDGIAALDLTLPAGMADKLAAYLALLAKWNKTYNLTSIRDPQDMVTHHLLDSLSVLPVLDKKAYRLGGRYSLVDIGSGAGLPGLVIAMARPDWSIASVEAVEKKSAFQRQAAIELGLENVSIYCCRADALQGAFDAVIARAFASLAGFIQSAGHLASTLWAMKGTYPAEEVAGLPEGWRRVQSHVLRVPGLDEERCLLEIGRV